MTGGPSKDDGHAGLVAELHALVRGARGLLEWHELAGTEALPPSPPRAAPEPGDTAAISAAAPRGSHAREVAVDPVEPADDRASAPVSREAPPAERPSEFVRSSAFGLAAEPAREPRKGKIELPFPGPLDPRTPRLEPEEKTRRLTVLASTVSACERCGLCKSRTQTVFSRGNPLASLCFVGEGPGADEDAQGLPFVGKAGKLLDQMIAGMGMTENDVYIANIVKCRPPENRNPEPNEMAACLPYLTEQIEIMRPKVIVTLGNIPLKGLLNAEGIMKTRGQWKVYRNAIPVMPTFHPAYVLRNPTQEVKGQVWNDLKLVMKELGREIPKRGTPAKT